MIRGMTLVTTALVALAPFTASATPARPTSATPGTGIRDGRTTAEVPATPPASAVISLSVVPASDRADVIIGVDGPVVVPDFTLAADIHDVLAAFAAFSGRTILPSREVSGPVTAEISNQPWDIAMRAILNANGFDAVEDQNGIIIVDTFLHLLSRQNAEPLATRTIRLNYARATTVSTMVRERLSRDCTRITIPGGPVSSSSPNGTPAIQLNPNCPVRGAVTADSLTNSLSITDIPANLDELESYTRSIDLRQPQVNIKAKIILVDLTQLEGLGLRYDLGGQSQYFNSVVQRL